MCVCVCVCVCLRTCLFCDFPSLFIFHVNILQIKFNVSEPMNVVKYFISQRHKLYYLDKQMKLHIRPQEADCG
jgi:hypothetical protein